MSGRGNNNGRGGRGGRGAGKGRGNGGKGHNTTNGSTPSKGSGGNNKKLQGEEQLGDHVFTYGLRNSADTMKETMKAIAIYVGKHYSGHMQAELQERKRYVIPEPEPPESAQLAHKAQIESWKEDIEMEIESH
jgi:hypothetical protein